MQLQEQAVSRVIESEGREVGDNHMTRGSWRELLSFRWLRMSGWRVMMSDESETKISGVRARLWYG